MDRSKTVIRIAPNQMWRGLDVLIGIKNNNGCYSVMKSATFEDVKLGEEIPYDAHLHLCDDEAQQLMNDLWANGFRPTYSQDSKRDDLALKAQEAHIEDLRGITMQLLGRLK